ncbi:MAG: winged helix-turn-helix domain-containing protein [Acidobacteria bacterium]|nr:winged helix-turn-helix domain-containing protein [Acidobacteriota bacterium]
MHGTQETTRCYRFAAFCLDTLNHVLLQDGKEVHLEPKAYEILLMLLRSRDRLVSKDELKTIWNANIEFDKAIALRITQLRKALGDDARRPRFIETVPTRGFRFIAPVTEAALCNQEQTERLPAATEPPPTLPASYATTAQAAPTKSFDWSFGGHLRHALLVAFLYAALQGLALLVELAYEFDRHRQLAFKLAPMIFVFTFGTSLLGLGLDLQRTRQNRDDGLLYALTIFLAAILLTFLFVYPELPKTAVTQIAGEKFFSYPAQSAYLKTLLYFPPLFIVFLLIPFHLISIFEREMRRGNQQYLSQLLHRKPLVALPDKTLFLDLRLLAYLFLLTLMLAFFSTHVLLGNLADSNYKNLFALLYLTRVILWFALAMEGIIWYAFSLNRCKRAVFQGEQAKL